jgi:hypothetical protein
MRWILAVVGLVMVGMSGCASKYVEAVVRNDSGAVVGPFEVDYPSASFGHETLAAGAEYHYRFKILGSGGTKVIWTDAVRKEHTVAGPELLEGEQGRMVVRLTGGGEAVWDVTVKP